MKADPSKLESLKITPAPPAPLIKIEQSPEYFYQYRKALTGRLGLGYDTKSSATFSDIGASFLFSHKLKSYEAAADLMSDGAGLIHAYRRFIYGSGRFRPYSKVGIGVRIVPADQLATVLRYEHYQLRGGGGAEWLVMNAISARLDGELAVSARGLQALVTLGAVFAW